MHASSAQSVRAESPGGTPQNRTLVDALVAQAPAYGWKLMFPDRHPHAGGEQHYAAYLEDIDGFEIELVAYDPSDQS
jgi:hypothetical protein